MSHDSEQTKQQAMPSFEDIAKARRHVQEHTAPLLNQEHTAPLLNHEDEMIFFAPRGAIPASHEPGERAANLIHTSVVRPQGAGSGIRSHDATPQESPSGTPSKREGNMYGRLFAPFIAHAGGIKDAPTSGPPPASVEKPGLPKPEPKHSDLLGHEYSEAVMAKHAAQSMLHNLPDAFSRLGEAIGGSVQYMVNKTVDVAHDITAPLDEGLEHRRPISPDLRGIPGVTPGQIDSPGAADSSLRMETLAGMQDHDVSPARKRENLVDYLTYPFTKDCDSPSRAVEKAKSYYEYLDEKKEDAAKKFPGVDVSGIAPGSMPNAPTSAVDRSTHTQLETSVAHAGNKAKLDSDEAAFNMEGGLPNKGLMDNADAAAHGYNPKAGGGAGAAAAVGTLGAAKANGIVGFGHNIHRSRDAATDAGHSPDVTPAERPEEHESSGGGGGLLSGLASKFEALLTGGRETAPEPAGAEDSPAARYEATGPGDVPLDTPTPAPTTTIGERMWTHDTSGYGRGGDSKLVTSGNPKSEITIPVMPFTSTAELLNKQS